MKKPISLETGNLLLLKKNHPCGSALFRVLRTGADIRLVCVECGRDLMLSREKVEKSIKQIFSPESPIPKGGN